MNVADVRESFLAFFESKGARRMPSSSLVPDDPSLLLTSAGMVQFKPVFLGVKDLGFTRAVTCQKCVRTTDIDIIGTTGRHHSFFEMLGNFSFGDYFKSEACAWAYEYSVDVLGLDPERLWYSIYEDDDEAEAIWRDEVGVPAARIVRMGAKDNFWSAGPTGPCGPCSELYYDQGPEAGCGSPECAPGCDCDRFVEYWNLVFMQYDRAADGSLVPLPKKSIDTGMGLERIAAILQKVGSNFETNELRALMAVAEELTGAAYGQSEGTDTSLRILADHARAVAFLVADGVLPSNEGRGYVLRRVLRRAVRHGRLLGRTEPFMATLVDAVTELMKGAYPELSEHHRLVQRIVDAEEHRFATTLRQGLVFLGQQMDHIRESGLTRLDGAQVFALHDTYGFPVELTAEIAAENGYTLDMEAFDTLMKAQRDRARAGVKDESWTSFVGVFSQCAASFGESEFVGYGNDETHATVVGIVIDGASVSEATSGETAMVVLDRTPFFAEQGGQVGDTGLLADDQGTVFAVSATTVPVDGLIVHSGSVSEGTLRVGASVTARIDFVRRERTRRNHTATHLLHWALRLILGEHVTQAGSHVSPERLRFDFTHFEAPGADALRRIEHMINEKIMENHPVRNYETSLRSAKESGVTALFGERYGEFVRVLEVGAFSKELCGGTHVRRTSEIGFLKIVSEGSVGANLRRIEAVTSFDALRVAEHTEGVLREAARALKCRPDEVPARADALLDRFAKAESQRADASKARDPAVVGVLAARAVDVGYPLVVARVEADGAAELRELADAVRARLGGGAVVFGTPVNDSVLLLAAGSEAAVTAGFDAGAVIKAISPRVSGGGGGKPAMAQAGGKDPKGLDEALAMAHELLTRADR